MTTPQPVSGSKDPSRDTGIAVVLTTLVVDALAYLSIPVDDTTKLIIAGVITVLAPAATALIIRLKAWAPASVAKLQADALALAHEAQSENPPPIVTNQALDPVRAAEAHPGGLGLPSYGQREPDTQQIPQHGRHERPEN